MDIEKILAQFDYDFPKNLIATKPSIPRDAAKLLIFDTRTKQILEDKYKNIAKYLPKTSVLVFNQTKVVPARLRVNKDTGGKATLLYISHDKKLITCLSDRRLRIGSTLIFQKYSFEITGHKNQFYLLKPSFPLNQTFDILEKFGETPLPPYIKNPKLTKAKIRAEYQTVFAKTKGSVAAPTASLHFTKNLLKKIEKSGIKIAYITLHVNLGTFASLTETQLKSGKLHSEWYEIDKKTEKLLNIAKKQNRPIIAVGTTVVRTLESASNAKGKIIKPTGTTDLFIRPGYQFKFITDLITNFHVPKSSLMMLVASLVGTPQLLSLYQYAITKKYRLFSFGDGMFIKHFPGK